MSVEDKLIDLVRENPHLFDKTSRDYKDTRKSENTWSKIATELGLEGGKQAKNRWSTLRQTFSEQLRKMKATPSGSAASDVPKWKYFDQLQFLMDHMNNRDTCTNLNSTLSENGDEIIPLQEVSLNLDEEVVESDIYQYALPDHEMDLPGSSGLNERPAKKKKTSHSPVINTLKETRSEFSSLMTKLIDQQENVHEADILGKLVSSTLKRLSPRRYLRAKRAIQAILNDIEEDEIEDV